MSDLKAMVLLMAVAGWSAPWLMAQAAPLILPYTITTVGGGTTTVCTTTGADKIGNGCPATQASFGATSPVASGGDTRGIGVDSKGNIIIADTGANMVRMINQKTGVVTVVAGSLSSAAACTLSAGTPVDKYGDGCVASDGTANINGGYTGNFNKPRGVYVAPNGDIYIAGYGDYMVHKVSAATGVMSIVAGYITCTGSKYTSCSGTEGYTGDGGTATNYVVVNGVPQRSPTGGAELYQPRGVTADSFGNVYVADTGDNAVRVVYQGGATLASLIATELPGTTAQVGYIYTIAGNPSKTAGGGSGYSGDGGLASASQLATDEDIVVDTSGNVIIADGGNNRIRVIYAGGAAMAKLITLENPSVAAPVVGYIYTVMGGGSGTYAAGTAVLGTSVTVGALRKIAMDSRGNLFSIDNGNNVVWFLDASTGYIRAIAGIFGSTYTANPTSPVTGICTGYSDNVGDGCPATQSVFSASGSGMGMAIDGQDNIYITDPADARIRKVSINTLFAATTPTAPVTKIIDVHLGAGETTTPAITFPNGNPDFAQSGASVCNSNGDTTVDCLIQVSFQPGHAGADPSSLLVSGTSSGAGVSLNGTGNVAMVNIDPGTGLLLHSPAGVTAVVSASAQQVATDGGGNVYVADTANNRILYFPASNAYGESTVAGGSGGGYTGDNGPAIAAQLNAPKGVAVDAAGNLYIADTGNNVIRRVDAYSKLITTIAGGSSSVCPLATDIYGDNCPATLTTFSAPSGLATDASGNLYVSDTGHNVIRQIAPNGYSYLYAGGTVCSGATDTYGDGCGATQAVFSSPAGLTVDGSSNLYIADAGNNLVRKIDYLIGITTAVAGNGQAGFGGDGALATSAQLSSPQGVAVDAVGDVFIADTGNSGLRMVRPSTGAISTIAGILGSPGNNAVATLAGYPVLLQFPRGVAVDGQGTLTIADSGNLHMVQLQRSNVNYVFGTVNVGSSSDTQVFNVTNSGTVAANSSTFTGSGSTGDLTLVATSTQGCSGGSLATGAFCSMIGTFAPSTAATETATYSLNSTNVANTTPPAIVLTGTGKVLISTSVAVTQTVPASGNPQYGQGITVLAKVTPSSSTAPMTGTITFKVDGVAGAPVSITYAGGVATASFAISSQSVGSHTVTAVYSGDFNYAASNNNGTPLTIAVTKANTTIAPSSSPATLLQFSAETVTAKVTSTTTGTPTGTVSFFNGTALLGTSSLNSSGVATFISATLGVGSYSVTGVYSGDGNYSTSTSTPASFTVNADPQDFQLTLSTTALAVASGSTVQTTLSVTPTNTLAGTLSFACSGLPLYATCTFGPPSTLAVAATTNLQTYWQQPIPVTVTFWSNVPANALASSGRPGGKGMNPMFAFGWPVMLMGLAGLARKRLRRSGVALFALCVLAGASMTLSGCGSAVSGVRYSTPNGTSNVTITVTGPASTSHTIAAQYTITGPGL